MPVGGRENEAMRDRSVQVQCGHDGCAEFGHYTFDNMKEARRIQTGRGGGKWRCTRHSAPDEMLGVGRAAITHEVVATRLPSSDGSFLPGLFWCRAGETLGSGFTYGPGFKAYASDFPEGTTLRVTATIVYAARKP